MIKNKKQIVLVGIIIAIILIPFIYSQEVCCEQTKSRLWCQYTDESNCNMDAKQAPTSCESTSYCKTGCCYDSQEGLCMENTPRQVCNEQGGSWSDDEECNIPQCSLGCCILVDQGAFVTLSRCKQMSGFYGLNTDFRQNIADEVECIATAHSLDKGACVFELDYGRNCVFTTRDQCTEENIGSLEVNGTITNNSVDFYANILCSAEELGVDCGPSTNTTLVPGKDEVYFKDTCGNIANIYDASKYDDDLYWKEVYKKEESCGYDSSNAGSKDCGNCDYYRGSIGVEADSSTGRPTYGDYICIDLDCDNGKKHGESWCIYDSSEEDVGRGNDKVGSRHFKQVCLYGEIITEPCADFRNEICIEGSIREGYTEAQCRINRWQDCTDILEEDDCINTDLRECIWRDGFYFSEGKGIQISQINNRTPQGLCLPAFPPGFQFWGDSSSSVSSTENTEESQTTENPFRAGLTSLFGTSGTGTSSGTIAASSDICSAATTKFTIKFKKEEHLYDPLIGKESEWECQGETLTGNKALCEFYENAKLTGYPEEWINNMTEMCDALGDCGASVNWVDEYSDEGFVVYDGIHRKAGAGGAEIRTIPSASTNTEETGAIGSALQDILRRIVKR